MLPVSLGWRSRCLASVLISRSKIGVSTPNSFKGLPTVYKYNPGDHDQLKGEKYKITLCGENINIQTFFVTTSGEQTPGASESGMAVSLLGQCLVF